MQKYYQKLINNLSILAIDTVPFELGPCEPYRFGNMTKDTEAMAITGVDWVCPKNLSVSLLGSKKTLRRDTLRIRVVPCN